MRKTLTLILSIVLSTNIFAQEIGTELNEIQSVANAFISLRDAVAQSDDISINKHQGYLRSLNLEYLFDLTCLDSLDTTHKNNDGFVGNLMSDIAKKTERGETADGSYRTRTCYIKAGMRSRYELSSKGHQELAVIAEAGGLITLKIHVTNRHGLDKRYDDIKNVKIGLPQRQVAFDLPENTRNVIELEIINCGTKDCCCVIISN